MSYHGDPRPTHWTSTNGRVTPICDLEDNHLRNILVNLEKRGVKAASEAVDAVFQADDPSPEPRSLPPFPQQMIHDSLITVVRTVAMVPMYRELLREAKTRFIVLDAVVQEQQQPDPRMVTRAPTPPPETCPVTYTSKRSGKSARCVLPKGHSGKHTI